jgi:alpha-1,6-mannosyltransferase
MSRLPRPALVVGLLTEAIYLAAVLGPFSLLTHGQELADLGKLTAYSAAAAAAVTLGLVGLFVLYACALRVVSATGKRALPIALIGTLVFSVTLVFLYPITAIDVYNYAVQGHVAFFYHVNPLAAAPSSITGDPFVAYGSTLADTTSPYGPVWIVLSATDAWLAGENVILAVLILKALAALAVLVTAGLLGWAAHRSGRNPALAVVLFGWNPLVLIELAGNGHNDAVLALCVVASLILARQRWPTLAVVCLATAILVKSLPIGAVPLFFFSLLAQRGRFWESRVPTFVASVIVFGCVLVLGYTPFWAGWATLDRLREVDANYLASIPALIVLVVPSAVDWLSIPQMSVLALTTLLVGTSPLCLPWLH